jgi:hypothetical protein
LVDWFTGALEDSLMPSSVALLVDVLGGGLSGELSSFSVGLITVGEMVDRFGFVVVDGVEAKDSRTWAANSARVAGMGRPGPLPRCSGVEVGGAGPAGGRDWGVGVAESCGALFCVGTGLCAGAGLGASTALLASMLFWGGTGAGGLDAGATARDLAFSRSAN